MQTSPDKETQRKLRGERIRWARKLVEPNRREFARKLGADPSTIRNIENGSRNASVELLERICHSLRISLDYVSKGRLTGVDPELAALLARDHPELLPERLTYSGMMSMGSQASTFRRPMTHAF